MFTVYIHITPSNKYYVGITSQHDVNKRFGINGNLYRNQIFGRAIQKYGWNNIQHIIVAQNLTEDEAKQLEIELIAKYKSNNPKYGYNQTIGGDNPAMLGNHHTEETKRKISKSSNGKSIPKDVRQQISKSVKALWQTDAYREKQNNRIVSDMTKLHMSEAHKGKSIPNDVRQKMSLSHKGKSYLTDEGKKRLSEITKRQHQKEKELGVKRNYNNYSEKTAGTKWYNNGIKNVRIKGDCPDGYVPGRLKYRKESVF